MERVFFLVGALRSGTTLLRLMLGHHPEICDCNEVEYIAPLLLRRDEGGIPTGEYAGWMRERRGLAYLLDGLDLTATAEQIARSFLERTQRQCGAPIIGAAVHNDFHVLPRAFPGARYVFLHRDPRDVAISTIAMGWHGNGWGAARVWLDAQQSLALLNREIPAEMILEVRFEDLVASPEVVLETICEFLGTRYSPQMLEIEKDTTYSRPDPQKARSWRRGAREITIRRVETRIGAQAMTRAGYTPSGHPPVRSGAANIAAMTLLDAIGRTRFRQKRYGVGLWAAHTVMQRLPHNRLRTLIIDRINEIDERFVR